MLHAFGVILGVVSVENEVINGAIEDNRNAPIIEETYHISAPSASKENTDAHLVNKEPSHVQGDLVSDVIQKNNSAINDVNDDVNDVEMRVLMIKK